MTMSTVKRCLVSSVNSAGWAPTGALFHSLTDGTRLAFVDRRSADEAQVVGPVEHLGLAQSTVLAHGGACRPGGRGGRRDVFHSLAALRPNYGTGETADTVELLVTR